MKKILKMMLALTCSTSVSLTVVACGQTDLDSFLNKIYTGSTNYKITDLDSTAPFGSNPATYTNTTKDDQGNPYVLTKDNIEAIAQSIVNKNEPGNKIPLFNNLSPQVDGTKCYSYIITNGKEQNGEYSFGTNNELNIAAGTLELDLSFEIGTVNNKKFEASQRINMKYQLIVQQTQANVDLENWVTGFNSAFNGQIIDVNLGDKIVLPSDNQKISDLTSDQIKTMNESISDAIQSKSLISGVTWIVNPETKTTVFKNNQIKVYLTAKLNNAKDQNTDSFTLNFKKTTN